VSHSF